MGTQRDIGIVTVPNLLSFARLAALPFVIALARSGYPTAAAIVFLIAMLTDCFDGLLAKRLNQRSVVGANWMGKTKASLQTILIAWGLLIPALATSSETAAVIQTAFNISAWLVLVVSWWFLAMFVHRNRLLLFQGDNVSPDEQLGGRC